MSRRISRATFLKGLLGCSAALAAGKIALDSVDDQPKFPCRILGPSMDVGHKIRDLEFKNAKVESPAHDKKLVIIGGGVAGLSAAWWLNRSGFTDFTLLELEKSVGGNSSSGANNVSSYPWGAHYVPLANEESTIVRTLFEEIGIINGIAPSGLPIYNDLYMCHDPEERLFKDGTFQEGLIPRRGLQRKDKEEVNRFFALMGTYRQLRGNDGKRAFAIPLELSSQDAELLALDKISMDEWMTTNGFSTRPLKWYIDYCCRDDYGSSPKNVSAWAGIHYFAGRNGTAANAETNSVVTWPNGNGFLIDQLKSMLHQFVRTDAAVIRLEKNDAGRLSTTFYDTKERSLGLYSSDFCICATPRFLAQHIMADPPLLDRSELVYGPWMVANITLKMMTESKGVGLAWDNVRYGSPSLGYVVATHQNITTRKNAPTVITYYYPLAQGDPQKARQSLTKIDTEEWSKRIVEDLEKMNPGIGRQIVSMDLWPWGHGMIRPSVGFIWGEARKKMRQPAGNVFFAHSDMSGISNFEEAQYRGVEAAKMVLAEAGIG